VLTKDECGQVEEAFATALAGQLNPKTLVEVVFKAEANPILLELPLGTSPSDMASFVIQACLVSRWSRDPALLEMLLNYLVTTRGLGAFNVVLSRVRRREDPNPSVYDSTWLIGQRPFFDRQDFRRRVQRGGQRAADPPRVRGCG